MSNDQELCDGMLCSNGFVFCPGIGYDDYIINICGA